MNWQEIRRRRPGQWLVVEALEAHTAGDRRVVSDLAVVEPCDDSESALKTYLRLHRAAPDRELYVVHTDRPDLDIEERRRLGVRVA